MTLIMLQYFCGNGIVLVGNRLDNIHINIKLQYFTNDIELFIYLIQCL